MCQNAFAISNSHAKYDTEFERIPQSLTFTRPDKAGSMYHRILTNPRQLLTASNPVPRQRTSRGHHFSSIHSGCSPERCDGLTSACQDFLSFIARMSKRMALRPVPRAFSCSSSRVAGQDLCLCLIEWRVRGLAAPDCIMVISRVHTFSADVLLTRTALFEFVLC